eukprot:COSAG02_NODE_687_length_18478_cov_23.093476_14_plen_86_part_00
MWRLPPLATTTKPLTSASCCFALVSPTLLSTLCLSVHNSPKVTQASYVLLGSRNVYTPASVSVLFNFGAAPSVTTLAQTLCATVV